ncbi:uncharacterized protein METZ01_LOCUS326474, partial [marine metagenome]
MSLLLPPSPVANKRVTYVPKTVQDIFLDALDPYDKICYINERIN